MAPRRHIRRFAGHPRPSRPIIGHGADAQHAKRAGAQMTNTPPSIRNSPARTHVEFDLPCIKCDYNLRTLPIVAHCPECNTLVCDSVFNAEAAHDYAKVLADMRHGCAMLLGLLLVAIVASVLYVAGAQSGTFALHGASGLTLVFIAYFSPIFVPLAVCQMTMPLPGGVEPPRRLSLRVGARASLVAWPIALVLSLVLIGHPDPGRAAAVLGAPALLAISPICLLLHLRRQVRRFGYRALAILLVLLALDTVALALVAALELVFVMPDFDLSISFSPPAALLRAATYARLDELAVAAGLAWIFGWLVALVWLYRALGTALTRVHDPATLRP